MVKHKKLLFLLIILISIVIYIAYIQGVFVSISLEKQELTETKIVNYDQLYWIERDQSELADKIMLDKTRIWLAKEIQTGAQKVRFNWDYMIDNPQYDLIEIMLPTTRYIDKNGKIIEFISGKGIITKVHSEKGWESYKTNQ